MSNIPDMDKTITSIIPFIDTKGEKTMVNLPYNLFCVHGYQKYKLGLKTFEPFARHLDKCKKIEADKESKCTCGFEDAKIQAEQFWRKYEFKEGK